MNLMTWVIIKSIKRLETVPVVNIKHHMNPDLLLFIIDNCYQIPTRWPFLELHVAIPVAIHFHGHQSREMGGIVGEDQGRVMALQRMQLYR